jgi:hypothetical protein
MMTLHFQPFANCNFHFLILSNGRFSSFASAAQNQFFHTSRVDMRPSFAAPVGDVIILDSCSTIF